MQETEIHDTNKWYMHKSESVFEIEMHKILWDFVRQMDHLTQSRKPDLVSIKKKKKEKKKKEPTISWILLCQQTTE